MSVCTVHLCFNFLCCEGTTNTRCNVSNCAVYLADSCLISRFLALFTSSRSRILVFCMFSRCILVFFMSLPSRKLEFSSWSGSRDLFLQTRVFVFSHTRIFHVLADYFRKLAFSPKTRAYEGTRIRAETNQPPYARHSTMYIQYCPDVYYIGPTLNQHWLNDFSRWRSRSWSWPEHKLQLQFGKQQ